MSDKNDNVSNIESTTRIPVIVKVEYCPACGYAGKCLSLVKRIHSENPEVDVICQKGRQGSFEISINEEQVYSKLQTMALPDYNEVTAVVKSASEGGPITKIKAEQPITCSLS